MGLSDETRSDDGWTTAEVKSASPREESLAAGQELGPHEETASPR
jgi:hypothetical protein